ncbi:MAG: hypothetical protein GTN40_05290 [Candidatus Aenigmarchaeota archaeon]|nr:hypothetical protein [Candidatus Aenigmarchaeota archaeon]
MKQTIGIDAMASYVPSTLLDLVPEERVNGEYIETEFSRSRKSAEVFKDITNLPSYLARGIGAYQFGFVDGKQDPVTMGAMSFKKLIEENDLELSEIGRFYVGTESPVDNSKPNAMYIVGAVERLMGKKGEMINCTPLDLKFACAGATAGLELLAEWIETGKNRGKYGVVIATDVATYPLESREEVTQGAGSVAMLVKENPRLIALENNMNAEITSTVSRDERDFFRPVNRHTAVVDGPLSIECYLDTSKAALINYRKRAIKQGLIKDGELLTEKVNRILLHLPFHRMAEYASVPLYVRERRNTPMWKEIEKVVGPEPKREDVKATKIFRKKVRETEQFKEFFAEKIEKGAVAAKRTGNTYTGSLYMGLSSMLELESQQGTDLSGMRFVFGSYASGSMFKAFTGIVQPDFKEVVRELDLLKSLDKRERNRKGHLSLKDYERLHEKDLGIEECVLEPKKEFVLANLGTSKVDEGYRYYEFVD